MNRNGLEERAGEFGRVIDELVGFLESPMIAAAKAESFEGSWDAGGPWRFE